MKPIFYLIYFATIFSCEIKRTKSGEINPIQFKVAAYNVQVGRNASAQEIGEALKPYEFDIVCFSEAPGGDWTREAGRVLGLPHIVVGKYTTAGHKDKYKTIASRTPLYGYEEILMADTLHTVTKAVTQIAQNEISIYSVHFPFGWRDQAHIDETTGKITAFVDFLKAQENDQLAVVLGDFNFVPSTSEKSNIYHDMFIDIGMVMSWNDLQIDLSKRHTNKANKLSTEEDKRVIDHIMYPENLIKAVDGEIIEMEPQLSDHKPVWALLQLK